MQVAEMPPSVISVHNQHKLSKLHMQDRVYYSAYNNIENKNFLQKWLRCRDGIKSKETSGCYRVKH